MDDRVSAVEADYLTSADLDSYLTGADLSGYATESWVADQGYITETDFDADGDGYVAEAMGGDDCDDGDASVNPGAEEICWDGLDNDCDGEAQLDASCELDLSAASAKLTGAAANDYAGGAVSIVGDVDGDGYDDLLVGAPYSDSGALYGGAAHLVLGPVTGDLDLGAADAELLAGSDEDFAGVGVGGAGDVNGDGYDDLLVGAEGDDDGGKDAGAAYLVLGPVSGELDLGASDAKLLGESDYDYLGSVVAGAGDVNGDGYDDIFIGAFSSNSGGTNSGTAYLVLGPVSGDASLSTAHAKFVGESSGDDAGEAVDGAGDVDGDGYYDLLIGGDMNAAYLVLGPVTGNLDLSLADTTFGGESGDEAGSALSGGGDVDGDGRGDLLIGASKDDDGGSNAGAAYLLFGGGL